MNSQYDPDKSAIGHALGFGPGVSAGANQQACVDMFNAGLAAKGYAGPNGSSLQADQTDRSGKHDLFETMIPGGTCRRLAAAGFQTLEDLQSDPTWEQVEGINIERVQSALKFIIK